ncbi:MAG: DUF3786 domain-containing protein [bacterium]
MQALEIYKKLPKTNCHDCGEPACMAFALKVQIGQRKLSECHYVKGEGSDMQELAGTVEDSYEQTSNRLQALLKNAGFKESAAALGAEYDAGKDVIKLVLLNSLVEVRREGLFEKDVYCRDSWRKLIVYDYVLRKGRAPLSNEWVPFEHFPRTPSHVKSFQMRAEMELALLFEKDPDGLRERLNKLAGVEMPDEAKADLACRLALLPKVPLYLQFRAADDDFPASCKLFVDCSAIQYLDIEYIARLVAKCVELVTGKAV